MCESCPAMVNHNSTNEAEYEAAVDRAVHRRLATDRRYINAENAEEQAEAEEAITAEVERDLRRAAFALRIEQARL